VDIVTVKPRFTALISRKLDLKAAQT